MIFDPHYWPGSWPGWATVIGSGLNWEQIDQALDYLLEKMQSCYQERAQGKNEFPPIVIAVDEISALTDELPDAGTHLIKIAQQGRKVGMFTILTSHSTEVAQMGFAGKGNARENFIFIELPFVPAEDLYKPRVATIYQGNPRRKGNEPMGRYIVPPLREYTGRPNLNLCWLRQGASHPG
ncbi:MAG: hypothetical protein KKD28_04395 [Chloroflexi bacterium]|nr:hypothetical protein [Chloroflexota bacterium]